MGIGFKNNEDKKDSKQSNSSENYVHDVRLFGVKIFSSTKKHTIESEVEE